MVFESDGRMAGRVVPNAPPNRPRSRLGFTLIELLVIVAIIGIMLGSAVMSVGSGSASAQMKSATRRVLQLSRQARTMALLRQQAAVITYEEIYDGQTLVGGMVTIESKGDAAVSAPAGTQPLTISGEIPEEDGKPVVVSEAEGDSAGDSISKEQELMEKIVDDPRDSAPDKVDASDWDPDSPRSFRGIHLKVELLDDEGTAFGERKSRISVFSNVDFLRRQSRASEQARSAQSAEKTEEESKEDGKSAAQEPVSIVYETNGRCQPHRIKVWKDGTDEDSGLTITVDRFGKTKVEDER